MKSAARQRSACHQWHTSRRCLPFTCSHQLFFCRAVQRRLNGSRDALSESGVPAEADQATPDGASNGVPVFVMLPLDSVSPCSWVLLQSVPNTHGAQGCDDCRGQHIWQTMRSEATGLLQTTPSGAQACFCNCVAGDVERKLSLRQFEVVCTGAGVARVHRRPRRRDRRLGAPPASSPSLTTFVPSS